MVTLYDTISDLFRLQLKTEFKTYCMTLALAYYDLQPGVRILMDDPVKPGMSTVMEARPGTASTSPDAMFSHGCLSTFVRSTGPLVALDQSASTGIPAI